MQQMKGYVPEQLERINIHRKERRLPRCVAGIHPVELVAIGILSCVAIPGALICASVAGEWLAKALF